MFYTVYKIINTVNDKYYIGKHQTTNLDDGYMGSGKLITRAIKKYGKDKFNKQILFVFNTEEEMNAKEAEIVVVSEQTYNLCDGGKGGWGYINKSISHEQRILISQLGGSSINNSRFSNKRHTRQTKQLIGTKLKGNQHFRNKKHSNSTKKQMSLSHIGKHQGNKNSQYGTMWITNGLENKKIKRDQDLPFGFYKGRV